MDEFIENVLWDTEFFGIKIGKTIVYDESDFDPLVFYEKAIAQKYELIYVFKYGTMFEQHTVNKAGLELVDIMLTMSKKFIGSDYLDSRYEFRNKLTLKELRDCYKIAEQISAVSRFYYEPKIGPEKTKKLYKKWIDNTVISDISDGFFFIKIKDDVAGINLIKTDDNKKIGFCSLIGVSNKYQRLGIGTKLWMQAFGYWAYEKEINYCMVPFSIKNYKSINFHLKLGFNKIENIKYIYHFRKKEY